MSLQTVKALLEEKFSHLIQHIIFENDEITLEISPEKIREVSLILRDDPDCAFNMLIDICGVDYLQYGIAEWQTESTTTTGFERGVETQPREIPAMQSRFAAVYHLLSLEKNHRIRVRAFLDDHEIKIESVNDIWPAANWFEREAFDLFGIQFVGHPDLRRILTDYGFVGHPFRKDFPLIGKVEARYDAKLKRVVYDKVSIEPRVLEPKVIREDNRYTVGE